MKFLFKYHYSRFDVLLLVTVCLISGAGYVGIAVIALLVGIIVASEGQDALDRRANKGDA